MSWYERSIVTFSLAADRLAEMQESPVAFNYQAIGTLTRRSKDAQADMRAARHAFTLSRANAG